MNYHMVDSLTLRPFSTPADYQACTDLQEEVWAGNRFEWVPVSILRVSQKLGGIAAGAFDPGGRLMGFVFGLTGIQHGAPVHWSDTLAVRPEVRDQGLGTRLKWYQRELLMEKGIRRMQWTFDPLQARNGYLNFAKLGIVCREYIRDMYGETESPLHEGIGTDRFLALWLMSSQRVADRKGGRDRPPVEKDVVNVPSAVEVMTDGGYLAPGDPRLDLKGNRVRIPVPADIDALKAADASLALRWREATQKAFEHYVGHGYEVRELVRGEGHSHYVLVSGESGR